MGKLIPGLYNMMFTENGEDERALVPSVLIQALCSPETLITKEDCNSSKSEYAKMLMAINEVELSSKMKDYWITYIFECRDKVEQIEHLLSA